MKILNTKTYDELTKEASKDLASIGFSTSKGSIAKLFLNIINKYIGELYDTLTVNHIRAFVTTADADALDAIGKLLNCKRTTDEEDDNYRYRICSQCLVLATSNETAIELTALTTKGVDDVILKPYSMGTGTFTVIIITDPTSESTQDEIIETVRTNLLKVHGYGIKYNVVTPTINYIKIKQQIDIKNTISDVDKQEIKYNVQLAIMEYLSGLAIGESFMTDKITQTIMNVSPDILQESNISLYINNEKSIYVNQSCRWFERFCLSNETDNVVII